MHFEENQLSPSLISLSPLSTAHPRHFQLTWVRPSTESYLRFSLAMDRSLGFGSTACDSTPSSDSLSLRLPLSGLTLPHTITRRLILQKARHRGPRRGDTLTACKPTVSGTFHLSLTVLVHYRSPRNT